MSASSNRNGISKRHKGVLSFSLINSKGVSLWGTATYEGETWQNTASALISGLCRAGALLVNVETGEELAVAVKEYPHGVMEEHLPDGERLPIDYALQHPGDYLDVLQETIPSVLAQSGVSRRKSSASASISRPAPCCRFIGTARPSVPRMNSKRNRYAGVKLWEAPCRAGSGQPPEQDCGRAGRGFPEALRRQDIFGMDGSESDGDC